MKLIGRKRLSRRRRCNWPRWIAADLAAGGKGEIDLAAADKLNDELKAKTRKQPASAKTRSAIAFDYFLGRYLSLHGKPDEAIKHWKKCVAETETFDSTTRSIAGAELYDRGIKPESYKSLWEIERGRVKEKQVESTLSHWERGRG